MNDKERWKEVTAHVHDTFVAGAYLIGRDTPHEIYFLSLALCGEAGEVANLLKKSWRGEFNLEVIKDELAGELADVRIYLEHLARRSGIDLDEACNTKVEELQKRWPQRF